MDLGFLSFFLLLVVVVVLLLLVLLLERGTEGERERERVRERGRREKREREREGGFPLLGMQMFSLLDLFSMLDEGIGRERLSGGVYTSLVLGLSLLEFLHNQAPRGKNLQGERTPRQGSAGGARAGGGAT